MSTRLIGDTLGLSTAMLAEHHALLVLVGSPPAPPEAGRVGATLGRAFEGHICTRDPEECAELESLVNAWAALGHPVAVWEEIATAVQDHVERTESQLWARTSGREVLQAS